MMVGQNYVQEMVSDQWGTTGSLSTIGYYTVVGNPIITTQCGNVPLPVVGTPYALALQVQGSEPPYLWSMLAGSLPAGMYLTSDGRLKGTPTKAGYSGLFAITVLVRRFRQLGAVAVDVQLRCHGHYTAEVRSTKTLTGTGLDPCRTMRTRR